MIASTIIPVFMAILAGLVPVQSHGVMNSPEPYNLHTAPFLQVDPLNGLNGATVPFPCQGRFGPAEHYTTVEAGKQVFVNFTIGADHYGGSCQFSVTYDDPPPANKANWKAIFTIIGGCPAHNTGDGTKNLNVVGRDVDGRQAIRNCGNDHDNDCIREYYIPVPKGMPNGKATFAWTWFNDVGNREMYMNCAPIEITGGSSDKTFFNALPEMFVANLPNSDECWTGPKPGSPEALTEANPGILNIPNPGLYGKILEDPSTTVPNGPGYNCPKPVGKPNFLPADLGGNPSSPSASSGSSSTSPSVSTTSTASSPSTSSTSSTSPSSPKALPTSSTTTNCAGSTCPGTTTTTSTTSANIPPKPTTTATSESTTSTAASSTGVSGCPYANSFSCDKPDGSIVCYDKDTLGICFQGCAQKMKVAAGMKCEDGQYVAATTAT